MALPERSDGSDETPVTLGHAHPVGQDVPPKTEDIMPDSHKRIADVLIVGTALAILVSTGAGFSGAAEKDAAPRKPNVVFILADNLGYGDLGEKRNLADKHADVVRKLTTLANAARRDLGDLNKTGSGQRPVGRVPNPVPRRLKKR